MDPEMPADPFLDEDTVTIGRQYFHHLLLRANLWPRSDYTGVSRRRDRVITQEEHEILISIAKEYNTMRRNLLRSGLTLENLNYFASSDSNTSYVGAEGGQAAGAYSCNDSSCNDSSKYGLQASGSQFGLVGQAVRATPEYSPISINAPALPEPPKRPEIPSRVFSSDRRSFFASRMQQTPATTSFDLDSASSADKHSDCGPRQVNPQAELKIHADDKRTLFLSGLSPSATHKDIVGQVRGGMLIDLFIRKDPRCAQLSFLHGTQAQAFLNYVKRNGLYLNGKRIEAGWADRHFRLHTHMMTKIAQGATRILVLREAADRLTEDDIRDDMRHIHNLVIIDVKLRKKDIIVCTNSAQHAQTARTCMLSRLPYKKIKIGWHPDECAEPLPPDTRTRTKFSKSIRSVQPAAELKPKRSMNFYDVLKTVNIEATEDGENSGKSDQQNDGYDNAFEGSDTSAGLDRFY